MENDDITLGEFLRYREAEECGIVNMDRMRDIQERSWLTYDQITYIKKHYKELSKKYKGRIN